MRARARTRTVQQEGGGALEQSLELVAGYDHMFAGMPDVQLEALLERTTTFLLDRASPRPGSHLDEGADA